MSMPPPPTAPPPMRRAYRDLDDRIVGGVAAGLADHLQAPTLWVRVGFVIASTFGGLGVALYLAFWIMLPPRRMHAHHAPGIESASRGGRRPGPIARLSDFGPTFALGALALGVLFMLGAIDGSSWTLPVVFAIAGVTLLWQQADEAQRERWLDASGRISMSRVVLGDGSWASYARLAVGSVLVLGALILFSLRGGSLSLARDITLAALLGVAGLVVVVGPWVYRLTTELADERAERVRTQDRADVAAHLHDSVLQTLALIQKNPADATRLARAQERDLRSWLFDAEAADETTIANSLRGLAAEIEDRWGIAVDVVAVGDRVNDDAVRPLVAAAREAVTNAAKHAQVSQVDVYAEISPGLAEVFVRDRGVGFDPVTTPEDRQGVRGSIVDRMQRHGGSAEILSEPGLGTEVRLRMEYDEETESRG